MLDIGKNHLCQSFISSRRYHSSRASGCTEQDTAIITPGEIEWERGRTIYIPTSVTRNNDMWKELKHRVDQIMSWIKYCEMKEATTLFELALWKAKIDRVEDGIYEHDCVAYRIEVPGPVKDTILQYLDL